MLLVLCVILIALGLWELVFYVADARFTYRTFELVSVTDSACDDAKGTPSDGPGSPPMPNLVHYVLVGKQPSRVSFWFEVFLSIYSAHIFRRLLLGAQNGEGTTTTSYTENIELTKRNEGFSGPMCCEENYLRRAHGCFWNPQVILQVTGFRAFDALKWPTAVLI